MLGVFLLPAFTCLGHECQDVLSLCDGMPVCTEGGLNPWCCIKQDSEPNTLPTRYSGPYKHSHIPTCRIQWSAWKRSKRNSASCRIILFSSLSTVFSAALEPTQPSFSTMFSTCKHHIIHTIIITPFFLMCYLSRHLFLQSFYRIWHDPAAHSSFFTMLSTCYHTTHIMLMTFSLPVSSSM